MIAEDWKQRKALKRLVTVATASNIDGRKRGAARARCARMPGLQDERGFEQARGGRRRSAWPTAFGQAPDSVTGRLARCRCNDEV